jgi:vacuolar-type H+-ATPase subunit I/STV1
VINHEKVNAFERVLWRACRRTAFLRHSEIEEELENPDTGEKIRESVFIIFYSGDRLRSIIDRVFPPFFPFLVIKIQKFRSQKAFEQSNTTNARRTRRTDSPP